MTLLRPRRPWPAVALLCLVVAGGPASALTPQEVLRQAAEMLSAGLSSEFVLSWLESGRVPPARPTAEQAITLRAAGASDELMMRLLELSTEDVAGADLARLPDPDPIERVGPLSEGEGVRVALELSYAPRFEDGEPTWDFYVYLDGRPVSYVPATAGPALAELAGPLMFERRMAPGAHSLRVGQERHGRRGTDAWRHQARMASEVFHFELLAGPEARLEVHFEQGLEALLSGQGPVTFRMEQGERSAELIAVGGYPDEWAEVCEDVENEAREWSEKRRKRRLEGCVSWADFWPGIVAPSRGAVWEALAAFDFRPVPRSSQG